MNAQELKICEESPAEQEEVKQAARMKLKEVQNVDDQKENFTFKKPFAVAMSKDIILAGNKMEPENKRLRPHKVTVTRKTQTIPQDELDLIGNDPSSKYWKKLAETRQEALRTVMAENEHLQVEVALLREKLEATAQVVRELTAINEILTEMVVDGDDKLEQMQKDKDDGFKAGSCSHESKTPSYEDDSD